MVQGLQLCLRIMGPGVIADLPVSHFASVTCKAHDLPSWDNLAVLMGIKVLLLLAGRILQICMAFYQGS